MVAPWGYGSVVYSTASIGTASGTVIAANANRKYLKVTNDANGTVVYLREGAAAAVNTGDRVNAGGGAVEMTAALGNVWSGYVTGIHAGTAGSVTLLVKEGV